ncbi:MAG: flagellar filament capping protein FliD [Treponema sp.]|jgi:flagellar capping protein FliD|nr:flagellar filament capping protein FliD [Treponema sp.]
MSDVYIPGISSRFNTDQLIESLMKVERLPKDRAEKNVEDLQTQKTYWQNIGQRITALRDSARLLYSFQNPFNDRIVSSSDPSVLSGTSTRQADNQEHYFTVKQIAQTDRFLSQPLDNSFRVDEGTYTFSIGKDEVSFNFRGGSLQEFVDTLNRRGTNKLRASLVAVQPGKKSLLIESRITGAENRLLFSGAAEDFAVRTGILEDGGAGVVEPEPAPVAPPPPPSAPVVEPVPVELMVREESLTIDAGGTALIPFDVGFDYSHDGILRFEIATTIHAEEPEPVPLEQESPVAEPAEASAIAQEPAKEAPLVSVEAQALSMAAIALAESATALSSAAAAITGAVAALTTPTSSVVINNAPEPEIESPPLQEEATVEETSPELASTAPAEEEKKPASLNSQAVLTIAEDASPQDAPVAETAPEDAPLLAEEAKEPETVVEEPPVVTQETQPEPEPLRVDNMNMLSLTFTDGTTGMLPPVEDSTDFKAYQYKISDIADGKTIASIDVVNLNTHRDLSIRNISFTAPKTEPEPAELPQTEPAPALAEIAPTPVRVSTGVPRTPVSLAQDAIIYMEGIEIRRPTNTFDDLLTGITLTVKKPSETPVRFGVEADREMIKDSIIALVGNYNQLMAEINVVTQRNESVINELTYLSEDERAELHKRLGIFSGDSTLTQYKTSLQRAAMVSYSTSADDDLALLSQIGIGTDVRGTTGSGGYDPSRLRGYLEIDEKALDAALDRDPSVIQQLFGQDTDGDLIVDSGIAYMFETLSRPYTEIGGVITLKTNTIDARISQEQRRIETLDRQLAAKEASLKLQYSQMEDAYNRMEQMSSSLDQFSQQSNNNR